MRFCVIARPLGRSNLKKRTVLDCFASLAMTKITLTKILNGVYSYRVVMKKGIV